MYSIFSSFEPKPKWAFLIRNYTLSFFVSVDIVVSFLYVHLLPKNHSTNFTKLDTKQLWVKVIDLYSNDGSRQFQRGDNLDLFKICCYFLKSCSQKPWGQKSWKMCESILRKRSYKSWSLDIRYDCKGDKAL